MSNQLGSSRRKAGKEGTYDVVWPLGRRTARPAAAAARLDALEGKTICELWNYVYGGDRIFPLIEAKLKERFANIRFIHYGEFGNTHGKFEREVIAALPGKLAAHGCDAVISGTGG